MKKIYFLITAIIALFFTSSCIEELQSVTGITQSGDPTESEVIAGLKSALRVSTDSSVSVLSKVNGFLGDPLVKIPFPPEAKKVQDILKVVGKSRLVDSVVVSLNRAAEGAAVEAKNIFVDAIVKMSIKDAFTILKGVDTAATHYLRVNTYSNLHNAFRPKIENSLKKVKATAYWTDVIKIYNNFPTTKNKINPDLAAYVTDKALNGLFIKVADEEKKIRKDPIHRVTGILKKVFGSLDN